MTRLSNRQYPMLAMFATASRDYRMTIEQAQQWDQRPFRSMLIQKWVAYGQDGFRLTDEGRLAWKEFQNTDIARLDPTRPLTAYFDPTAYGLRLPRAKRTKGVAGPAATVHTIRKRNAA